MKIYQLFINLMNLLFNINKIYKQTHINENSANEKNSELTNAITKS